MTFEPSPDAQVYRDQVRDTYLYWRDLYVRTRGASDEQVHELRKKHTEKQRSSNGNE